MEIIVEPYEVLRNNIELFPCSSPLGRTINLGKEVRNNQRTEALKTGQRKANGLGVPELEEQHSGGESQASCLTQTLFLYYPNLAKKGSPASPGSNGSPTHTTR